MCRLLTWVIASHRRPLLLRSIFFSLVARLPRLRNIVHRGCSTVRWETGEEMENRKPRGKAQGRKMERKRGTSPGMKWRPASLRHGAGGRVVIGNQWNGTNSDGRVRGDGFLEMMPVATRSLHRSATGRTASPCENLSQRHWRCDNFEDVFQRH